MTLSYEAYGPKGNLVATFGAKDQAEAYRDRMAALGTAITVKVVPMQRRAA